MANGVNKCFFIGNLGQDPEVRYSQSGVAVCNFSIACNERRKVDDAWEDHTEWIRVVCFGKTAENVGQYLAKGRSVHVEARCQTRKWEDKEGNDRWSTEFVAHSVLFLGGGGGDEDRGGGNKRPPKSNKSNDKKPSGKGGKKQSQGADDDDFVDDDLPF